jgi:hypothetical protein
VVGQGMAPAFMSCSDKIMRNDGLKKLNAQSFALKKVFWPAPQKSYTHVK